MFNVKILFLLKNFSYGLFVSLNVFLMGWEIFVSFVSYRLCQTVNVLLCDAHCMRWRRNID